MKRGTAPKNPTMMQMDDNQADYGIEPQSQGGNLPSKSHRLAYSAVIIIIVIMAIAAIAQTRPASLSLQLQGISRGPLSVCLIQFPRLAGFLCDYPDELSLTLNTNLRSAAPLTPLQSVRIRQHDPIPTSHYLYQPWTAWHTLSD